MLKNSLFRKEIINHQEKFWRNRICAPSFVHLGFPHSSVGKESTCNAGVPGLIPGSGRSAEEGIGYPIWYSWASFVAQLVKNLPAMWETWVRSLEKRKATHYSILAWRIPCIIHGVTKSHTWLSDFHFHLYTFICIYIILGFSLITFWGNILKTASKSNILLGNICKHMFHTLFPPNHKINVYYSILLRLAT